MVIRMIWLQAIRGAKNISQKKLSEISGVPCRTIEDIEKRGDCRVSTAVKIAKALNVSLDVLVSGNVNLCDLMEDGKNDRQ